MQCCRVNEVYGDHNNADDDDDADAEYDDEAFARDVVDHQAHQFLGELRAGDDNVAWFFTQSEI